MATQSPSLLAKHDSASEADIKGSMALVLRSARGREKWSSKGAAIMLSRGIIEINGKQDQSKG